MRLLVIEDQYPSAQWLKAALAQIGNNYQMSHVTTIVEAMRELQSRSAFDVALVKLDMVDEDSYVLFHPLVNVGKSPASESVTLSPAPCMEKASMAAACEDRTDNVHERTLAHELCNELNVVALEADVIQLAVGCGESVQVDQSIARIHQKCSAVASIIRQLQFPKN